MAKLRMVQPRLNDSVPPEFLIWWGEGGTDPEVIHNLCMIFKLVL